MPQHNLSRENEITSNWFERLFFANQPLPDKMQHIVQWHWPNDSFKCSHLFDARVCHVRNLAPGSSSPQINANETGNNVVVFS